MLFQTWSPWEWVSEIKKKTSIPEMDEPEKEEDIDRLKFRLEQQKFALEQEKWQADLELRRRELKLKEKEARRRRGFLGRLDPISVGVFSAALVSIGSLITTSMQNSAKLEAEKKKKKKKRITHTRQLDLERERFESDLIKDYIKTKPERVEENLRFLIRTGLVRLKASQLQMTLHRRGQSRLWRPADTNNAS